MNTMIRILTGLFSAILIFLFLLIPNGFAQTDGLTPEQVAKIKSVGDFKISDDGSKAAYTLRVQADPFKDNKTASYELHVADTESGESTPYFTEASVSSIAFRPGHNTITFLARKESDESTSLYEITLDGKKAEKIYSFETSISSYDWNPDGDHLAFTANEPREETPSVLPYEPDIYEENLVQRRAYVTNVTEMEHEAMRVQLDGSIYQIHWGPDGQRLAVAAAPTPLVDDFYMKQQVVIVDRHGKKILGEVDHKGKLGQVEWSPDGSRLAMIAGAHINDPIAGRLMVVSSEGGKPDILKPDYKGMFEQFQWVDSNTLCFISSESAWSIYGTINSDGSNMKTIIDRGGPSLGAFDRAENGTVAFEADRSTHPAELYVMKKGENQPERVTDSNPWLVDVEMGRQEVVTWQARDGKKLEGILIYPMNYNENNRYPLITTVHGGPESHYDNGWITSYDDAGQVGAAQGYAVFYPNYRGSTGRGVDFAMSSQGDLAGAEFDDIVDGVDHLIANGIADSNKVGVTGGSYGGYATGWMSTRYTDRFAAGVMFVGISDNISKWGTSDIPEELYLVHARDRIWEDYDFFLKRSPIYHAGQAETPLLILAGKEDTRVDPGQSYELYRHIKTRTNTPVRLVLYPGEGHGNAHATARFDYNLRMMRWFNHYLKGEKERPDSELDLEKQAVEN